MKDIGRFEFLKISRRRGLNPQPWDYKSHALPIELRRRYIRSSEEAGFEPAARVFSPCTRLAGERLRPLGHSSIFFWFRGVDSNHDSGSQSPMSCQLDDPGTIYTIKKYNISFFFVKSYLNYLLVNLIIE